MALDIVLLKTPYSVAFTGNPMLFVFALAPYGDTEKAQVILLQVRVLIEDTYGTGVFTEAHSQNIYPDNNGMVTLDVHTLIDPYLKWFLPKPTMAYGVIKEAPEQRKRYKLSFLLQQNSEVIGQTQETGLFLAIKGGLSYESWKPVDFFNQAEAGQPLHFPVSKNVVMKDQPLFFWWLMSDVPQAICIPVTLDPSTNLQDGDTSQEYDDFIYLQGSQPIVVSDVVLPAGLTYTFDGKDVHIGGTPTMPEQDATISFTFTNCSGEPLVFEDQINITGVAPCIPVTITSGAIPDAVLNVPFEFFITYTGSMPITMQNVTLPVWMNFAVYHNQPKIRLYGTPTATGTSEQIAFIIDNCAASPVTFSQQIDVNASVCNAVQLDNEVSTWSASQNASFGFSIPYTGTSPVAISSCTGDASGMFNDGFPKIIPNNDGESGVVRFEGVADVPVQDYFFTLVVTNCSGATDTFTGSFNVTGNATVNQFYLLPIYVSGKVLKYGCYNDSQGNNLTDLPFASQVVINVNSTAPGGGESQTNQSTVQWPQNASTVNVITYPGGDRVITSASLASATPDNDGTNYITNLP